MTHALTVDDQDDDTRLYLDLARSAARVWHDRAVTPYDEEPPHDVPPLVSGGGSRWRPVVAVLTAIMVVGGGAAVLFAADGEAPADTSTTPADLPAEVSGVGDAVGRSPSPVRGGRVASRSFQLVCDPRGDLVDGRDSCR
jgi:hypothetical protein